jgi:hypothetical protein
MVKLKLARGAAARIAPHVLLLLGVLTVAWPAAAQEIRLTRLVDDRTLPPDGSGSFGAFRDLALEPAGNLVFTDGERVFALVDGRLETVSSEATHGFVNRVEIDGERVFWSERTREYYRPGAIFLWERGSSRVLVDGDTLIPGTECPFFDVGFPDWQGWRLVQGGALLFDGGYDPPGTFGECDDCPRECQNVGGTYLWKEGAIEVLHDHRGPVIEDQGRLFECYFQSVEGSRKLYLCTGSGGYALYLFEADGTQTRVVATGDPIPGRSTSFSTLGFPATLRRGRIVFRAYDDSGTPGVAYHDPGVYGWDGTSLSTILDPEMLASQHPGLSPWNWRHHFDGRNVAVHVPNDDYPDPALLYLAKMDGSGAVPLELDVGRPVAVAGFGEFSGGWLPLTLVGDYGNYARAVYVARADGSLVKVLEPGDEIDGRTVTSVVRGRSGGSTLVLAVSFSDLSYDGWGFVDDAIYAAALPPTVAAIDVRPHSRRNRIHPARRELVPVALLGSADLDVADVDVASLAFGPDGAPPWRGRVARRDVNDDGLPDLVARFRSRKTGLARGDTKACLSGRTLEAVAFEGCDPIRTERWRRGERVRGRSVEAAHRRAQRAAAPRRGVDRPPRDRPRARAPGASGAARDLVPRGGQRVRPRRRPAAGAAGSVRPLLDVPHGSHRGRASGSER